ncbi:copia protein [Tanacetum coccineum]
MENSQSQQASTNPSISTSHVRKVYTNEDVVRIRPTTRKGDVWSNFDMCIMIDGVEKARCKKCMKFYNPASNTTLRTHKNGCNAVSQNDTSQGTIGADGQVFIFDNDAVRLDFTKFVIQQALPFNHFDNVKLTEIIKRRLQPRYQHVSRTTLRSDAFKLWETAKKDIIDGFRDYKYGVSITTDTWTAPHGTTNLPNSFWGYALEYVARILNMVPTKKVERTVIWHEKAPKLSYLRVWGCEALVKRDTPDKLDSRSILKDDTQPSENTSKRHDEVEPTKVEPHSVEVPIRRPGRISQAPDRYGNSQVKDNKIDLLVQQYEQFIISEDESIDSAFARFNTIITSLKALDEGYSSKNYVRKFLRALHPKWRAMVTAIEESKDLTSLSLDDLIRNLKFHEMVIKKDSEIVKEKVERKSLALKAKKECSDEECSTFGSKDEEYAMAVRDFKKFFKRRDPNPLIEECPKPPRDKNQRAFVGGSWSDSGEEDDDKIQDETYLVAQAPNEVCFESSYFSDENSSIDKLALDNEYDKLCKMSLKIITKNKRLKAIRNSLENELRELKDKLSTLEKNKGVDIDCAKCHTLKIENEKLKEESTRLNKFEKSTHCLNEMLNNQKPSGDKLGLGFNSFEASSSGTKEIKFVKAQKKTSSDGGPINMGGPLNVQAAPKINMGPPPATPGSEKSVSFQKSILGPRPKHIIVNKVKIPVASDNEVKQFYKPLTKPGVGFSKTNFRSKTPPPRRVNNNYSRPKTPQPKRHVGRQNQPHGFPICLGVDLEPDEWIKDSGCSKHMTGNQKLFSTYKAYNGAQVSHNMPKNIVSTTRCLELLHMDLFGPSAVRSYGGNRYTLVIVDDYSRIDNSVNKRPDSTVENLIMNAILRVFNANGITHNFSAPRTPQSNGVCFILNTKDYLTKFDPKSYEGVFLGYSQNSKAYIILNKHTRKIKESLNVTFDETPPPSKTSPLVDDDLDEEEAIREIEKKNLENVVEDETLEIDEIVNIKESRNHPLENVIGNLNQRTLRSQAQNQSNFYYFISTIEPKNVNEALGDESWIVAMQEELNQFIANDVWDYNQQEGIDYDETYALVARLESIRILLAYACALDFKLFQMDVKSAFLNGFINEEVYVAQPPGFIDFEKPDHVYKLKKALYGLKQAPKAWYDRLKAFLIKHEYKMGMVDNTLFTKKKSSNLIIVQIYVDDIIFGSTCQDMCDEFAKIMHDEFEMSMMGELNFFLGLQIKQMEDGTTHLGLWYPKGTGIETVVYADSDHAGDYVDRKSTSGIVTVLWDVV